MTRAWVSFFSVLIFATLGAGCRTLGLGVQPRDSAAVPPDAPIVLLEPAATLRGGTLDSLVRQEDASTQARPLDTHTLRTVAQQVSPAVVSIFTRTQVPYRIKLLPLPGSGLEFDVRGEALGSGFFISPEGYLLTNAHVVQNATAIVARTQDDIDHDLLPVAVDRVFDLALLKVAKPDRTYPTLPMGRSQDTRIGDFVLAIGNPLGLGHTVTHGIVSQTGRQIVPVESGSKGRAVRFLQTDTPINPGSSGGPLVTLDGHFIAVSTAVLSGTQGISFCVPSEQVKEFLESVLQGEGVAVNPPR